MGQLRFVHLLDDAVEKADAAGRFAVADLRRRRRDGHDAGGQQFFAQQRVYEAALAPLELADDRDRDALVLQLFLQRGSPCGLRAQDLGRRQQFLRFFYVFQDIPFHDSLIRSKPRSVLAVLHMLHGGPAGSLLVLRLEGEEDLPVLGEDFVHILLDVLRADLRVLRVDLV